MDVLAIRGRLFVVLMICHLATWMAATRAEAAIRLPRIFSDHTILQRETGVSVWGWSDAGEKVTVTFAKQSKTATADAEGKWLVRLDPMPANAKPQELVARGASGNVTVHDVLVGEVWLAGGQSNMHFPMSDAHNAAEVLPACADDGLRSFHVGWVPGAEPLDDVGGGWKASSPDTTKDFSAVGYFFARELREKLNCPVGIINASWSGTPIQPWISLKGLQADPPIDRLLKDWDKAVEQYKKTQADPKLESDYRNALKVWQAEVEPAYKPAIEAYYADKAAGKPVGEKPKPPRPEPSNPNPMGQPSPGWQPIVPAVCFNGMIAPLSTYSVRGVIWYQGESNSKRDGRDYRTWFPRLIQDWRAHWNQPLPFLFVQIPAGGVDQTPVATTGMPWLREAQLMTLREPKTAMAITIDIGDPNDDHPTDKIDVGHRLALLARRDLYGEDKLVASGPLYDNVSIEGGKARVRFKETGTGLTPGQAPWRARGVEPLPVDKLIGFFIAGDDRQWFAADAAIEGNSVIVSSPSVARPAAVRYGWARSPRCNLYNREGLPASPFRTDEWESADKPK